MFKSFQKFLKKFEQGMYDDVLDQTTTIKSIKSGIGTIEKYYDDLNKQLNKEREEILDQIAENFNQQVTEDGKTYKELRQQITDEINKLNDELSDEAIEVQRESLSQFLTDTIEINKQIDSYINERKNKLSELSAQLNSLDNEEANQRLKINQEIDDKIAANNLKKEQAVAVARQNIWKQTSAKEKATLFKRNAEELADKLEQYRILQQNDQDLSEQQKKEYQELLKAKEDMDRKYFALRKQQISELSREERLSRYKQEAEEIYKESRAQKALSKEEHKDNKDAERSRNKEIDLLTKTRLKETQEKYGLSKLEISSEQTTNILSGISDLLSGKSGAAEGLMSSLFGESGVVAGAEATGVAGAAGLSAIAGPIGIALTILQTIAKVVGKINEVVAKGVEEAANARVTYMAPINTRLQGLTSATRNYYEEMINWSADASDDFGLAIGDLNAFVDRQKYIERLNTLIQDGIAYNAEERALLQTMSDKLVTTFDVMDASLTRLVRLQQRDMTYAALGSESLLTQFLNRFNAMGGIADTSYLSDVYDSVSATLLDAVAKLNADDATAFSYEVQKWLGALYSLGLSQEGVQSLAKGITYLQTGNVSELSSNQQLQYIYSAAAERAGLSIGDILVSGLDVNTTNSLLQNVVELLQDIYNNSSTNAVQSAWTNITGLSISDLKAITNVTDDYMAYISNEHQGWVSSWEETSKQIQMISDKTRTSSAEAIQNIINNAIYSVGENIVGSQFRSRKFDVQGINSSEVSTTDKTEASQQEIENLSGKGFLGSIINDVLGIGGMDKYSLYYTASVVGGTLGNIVQSIITLPAIIDEVKKVMPSLGYNFEQSKQLALDDRIFNATNNLYTVLTRLEEDRLIDQQVRNAENVSLSTAITNVKEVMDAMEDKVNYQNIFITAGIDLQTQNNKELGSTLSKLTDILDNPPEVRQSDFITYNNTYSNDIYNYDSYSTSNYSTDNSVITSSYDNYNSYQTDNSVITSSYDNSVITTSTNYDNSNLITNTDNSILNQVSNTSNLNQNYAVSNESIVSNIDNSRSTNISTINNSTNTDVTNIDNSARTQVSNTDNSQYSYLTNTDNSILNNINNIDKSMQNSITTNDNSILNEVTNTTNTSNLSEITNQYDNSISNLTNNSDTFISNQTRNEYSNSIQNLTTNTDNSVLNQTTNLDNSILNQISNNVDNSVTSRIDTTNNSILNQNSNSIDNSISTYSNDLYTTNNITNIDNTMNQQMYSEINQVTGTQAAVTSQLYDIYDQQVALNTEQNGIIRGVYSSLDKFIDTQLSTAAMLTTFQSQADAISETQVAITNESNEDRMLIEEASDIQKYLFENERLIRVSLSLVEPDALGQLDNLSDWKSNRDEVRELISSILSIMQDKVPVDLIDNDVNAIMNNLYKTRYY